jgi:hypothetical protein
MMRLHDGYQFHDISKYMIVGLKKYCASVIELICRLNKVTFVAEDLRSEVWRLEAQGGATKRGGGATPDGAATSSAARGRVCDAKEGTLC